MDEKKDRRKTRWLRARIEKEFGKEPGAHRRGFFGDYPDDYAVRITHQDIGTAEAMLCA